MITKTNLPLLNDDVLHDVPLGTTAQSLLANLCFAYTCCATVPRDDLTVLRDQLQVPASVDALAWREVNLDAVAHNVGILASCCAPADLMVVVKADAYSHGAVDVARTALAAGATRLGVAVLAEAFELRRNGIDAPLFAWLAAPGALYADALLLDIELAAYSCAQLEEIAQAAEATGRTAVVHLKAETGMWRGGAEPVEWRALTALARRYEQRGLMDVIGIWSHLACADVPEDPANNEQLAAFHHAVEVALHSGLRPRLRHLANSAATLSRPDMHLDMVRCGLSVYGVDPIDGADTSWDLRQAMSVRARIVHVKHAPKGSRVSYGHTYETAEDTRLAVVPLGYADGVPLLPDSSRPAGYRGTSVQLAGRVCMDQLVLDVGSLPIVAGDEVTLFGPGTDGEFTAIDWAAHTGRSVYEMFTGFGRTRVPLRPPPR